jgi:MraZ protein
VQSGVAVAYLIVISPTLREYAQLERNIVVVGASDHAEIWNEAAWKKEFDRLTF